MALLRAQRGLVSEVYSRYWLEVCRYVGRTFGAGPPDPEDVAQTAFTRFAALDDPARIDNPRAFLFATARNIVVDHHRRSARHRAYVTEAVHDGPAETVSDLSPERVLLGKERFAILQGVLQRMPRRRRAMLLLNRFDGVSLTEIARRFGISEAAVRKQIRLAMRDCMAALEAEAKSSTARRDGGVG